MCIYDLLHCPACTEFPKNRFNGYASSLNYRLADHDTRVYRYPFVFDEGHHHTSYLADNLILNETHPSYLISTPYSLNTPYLGCPMLTQSRL